MNGYGSLQGGVGWPLNTTENQRGTATELENRRQLLSRTLERGRGPIMAPYHRDNGGPLNTEQINNIIAYIQYGPWPVAPVEGEAAKLVRAQQECGGQPDVGIIVDDIDTSLPHELSFPSPRSICAQDGK